MAKKNVTAEEKGNPVDETPDELGILPLHDVVAYPFMIMPLTVARLPPQTVLSAYRFVSFIDTGLLQRCRTP